MLSSIQSGIQTIDTRMKSLNDEQTVSLQGLHQRMEALASSMSEHKDDILQEVHTSDLKVKRSIQEWQEALERSAGSQEFEKLLGESLEPVLQDLEMLIAEQQVIKAHLSEGLKETSKQLLREFQLSSKGPTDTERLRTTCREAMQAVMAGVLPSYDGVLPAPTGTGTGVVQDTVISALKARILSLHVQAAFSGVLDREVHASLLEDLLTDIENPEGRLRAIIASTSGGAKQQPLLLQVRAIANLIRNVADSFPRGDAVRALADEIQANLESLLLESATSSKTGIDQALEAIKTFKEAVKVLAESSRGV
jgi:hypothetical protein